jgi:hypothetical protein
MLLGTEVPFAACPSYGAWESAPIQILLLWRWDNDRDALNEHEAKEKEQNEILLKQGADKHAQYLSQLTYPKKRKQELFREWEGYRPAEIIKASRAIFRDTIDALERLGPRPEQEEVIPIFQRCIERFNHLDEEKQFIDSIERDDIFEEFEELVHLSGLQDAEELIDRWRDW